MIQPRNLFGVMGSANCRLIACDGRGCLFSTPRSFALVEGNSKHELAAVCKLLSVGGDCWEQLQQCSLSFFISMIDTYGEEEVGNSHCRCCVIFIGAGLSLSLSLFDSQ
jgi:hypothetical protein